MANSITGKFWNLDTTGILTTSEVFIKNIQITWKVSSAGAVSISEHNVDRSTSNQIFFYAKTLGATSAAVNEMTQVFEINNIVRGINLTTLTDVDKLIINTN